MSGSYRSYRWMAVFLAASLWATGCRSADKTQKWKTWEYTDAQVQTPTEQVETQWNMHHGEGDATAGQWRPGEPLSNTMTAKERRELQDSYTRRMSEQVEEQSRATAEQSRQANQTKRQVDSGLFDR